MTHTICLDKAYSTTRLVTKKKPDTLDNSENKFNSIFFLPKSEGRQGEGGLRTKGFFKISTPDKPLITVITVVFNGEAHLEESIQNVINQTYDNVEYIIIDGGSTDRTLDIIRRYEDRIDYWVSEKDRGIYDAMNKSVQAASGQWINFMNAGDLFFDTKTIEQVIPKLSSDFVYGDHGVYIDDPMEADIVEVKDYSDKRNIPFCHQALFEKRSWLMRFPFEINYKIAADYNHYLACLHHNAIMQHIPMTVARFLDGGLSFSSRKALIKEYYQVTKQYFPYHSKFVYLVRLLKFYLLGK